MSMFQIRKYLFFPNDRTYDAPWTADGETDAPAEETWK